MDKLLFFSFFQIIRSNKKKYEKNEPTINHLNTPEY